ncbi:VPS9 domain-containing protein 1-like [Acipenser oxyrinchus oxyrinchus]|uniref:VPS9 domain-containing protein 1-like n=1 Tax=Acipenser oxyrinchus oxyrinchus TaxID=40147 RepID=A0AAD8D4H7_ACIOX|nr:VPS9 domain-containing protein 1-like [Acipenser oxyrinchus oxyrinchus]
MSAAVPDGGVKLLQNAMKLANVAIELDTNNRHKEAYCEYLRSINFISQALLEEAIPKDECDIVTPDAQKMLKLAEQCLERVKSTTTKLSKVEVQPAVLEPPKPSYKPGHRRVLSDGGETASPFLPPEIFQRMQIVEAHSARKELTPIEEASRLNQKLKATYEARVARLNPNQAMQKTSLTLSLQRQMMENLIIARARQEALQRKMEERRLRLQEEANRSFSSSTSLTPEEQEQRILYASILEYEQDHDWPKQWKAKLKKNPNDLSVVSGLISYIFSCPEHPIMKLLKRLQYRIYNKLYPIVSKVTAPESPSTSTCRGRNMKSSQSIHCMQSVQENNKTNSQKLRHSLSVTSLPIIEDYNANTCAKEQTQTGQSTKADKLVLSMGERDSSFEDLEQFLSQFECPPASLPDLSKPAVDADPLIHNLEEGVLQAHLRSVVKDIHNSIDRLLSLYILSFEPLNTAASKDQCLASIEEAFFPPIWPLLLALFRKVYGHRELAFEKSMRLYRNSKPGDIGVASKLCPSESLPGSYPYESAVQELRLIAKDCCPQKKLECIVRTLRLICECAEEYRTSHEPATLHSSAAIGADDLLPILSYVALKSDLPQLVSECAALEEFIHEGYLIGEEGYCLTSMQSAVTYVESLHKGGALK